MWPGRLQIHPAYGPELRRSTGTTNNAKMQAGHSTFTGKNKAWLHEDVWNCTRDDSHKTLRLIALCRQSACGTSNYVGCENAPSKPEPAVTQLACAHYLPQQRCTNKQTDGMSRSEPWAEQPQGQQRCNRCTVRPLCQPTVHCAFNDNSLCQPIACCVFWDAKILRRHAAPDKSGQQCPSRHVANEPHDTPHHQRE